MILNTVKIPVPVLNSSCSFFSNSSNVISALVFVAALGVYR